MACNPKRSDAGLSDNKNWTPISGGTCDDGDPCTKNDTCVAGFCKGTHDSTACP